MGIVDAGFAGSSSRPRVVTDLPGPRSKALREREARNLAPGTQAISAYVGIVVRAGSGCEIEDVDGNRFLDLAAGIGVASLGYAHPRYASALAEQLMAMHVGSFTSEARIDALEALAGMLPAPLDRIQLYSGGSESIESAVRLARAYTGKSEVLAFWGGFHGKTAGALALMGSEFKHGLGPLGPGAFLTPYADCTRCPFRLSHPGCGLLCVEFIRDKLKKETTGQLAGILLEPMQGTAGNVIPPADWLPAIAELCRELGALLIADEMITGFGRTGRPFGIDHTGVVPDIMTLGKGMGGGYPVTAVATRDEVSQAPPWSKPSFSSSSFGGNPLGAAAIRATLGALRDEQLVDRSHSVGARLKAGLTRLAERHPALANVRGEGLLIGFDLVDPKSGAPWMAGRCRAFFDALLRRGVISMAYAPRVRVNPPLVLTPEQADEAVELIGQALCEVAS
jgi:4-aminobutyrate aminotransferase/(S)-3-amino-2-methylpropionate transaminase